VSKFEEFLRTSSAGQLAVVLIRGDCVYIGWIRFGNRRHNTSTVHISWNEVFSNAFCQTAWQFYLLIHLAMPMVSISPDLLALNCKNCSQMVNWILMEIENDNFLDLVFGFLVFQFFPPLKISLAFMWIIVWYIFLHHGWFVQNLGKDFIPTNMHTTVCKPWTEFSISSVWKIENFGKVVFATLVVLFQSHKLGSS
jgi:hypothetical protein